MKLPAFLWFIMAAALLALPWALPAQIEIEWVTGSEYNTVGFNIYRGDGAEGPFERLNEQLIPAEGGMTGGGQYRFLDETVAAGRSYYYILEDIEFSGQTEQHEPIMGQSPDPRRWSWPLALFSALFGAALLILDKRGAAPAQETPLRSDAHDQPH
jgi:hypothetical protein